MRGGLLLSDLINNMKDVRDDNSLGANDDPSNLKKFVHYLAHDLNLVVLLGMLDNWTTYPKRLDYALKIAIELHEENSTAVEMNYVTFSRILVY